jgi:signal transduction histidine kinase
VDIENRIAAGIALPSTPLRQALLNLLLNAVAASPEGGRVTVAAENTPDVLELSVTDRGGGLPDWAAEVLTAMSPSPPSLAAGGLGLWTTSRLVADMGGKITVDARADRGTVVRISIPLRQQELAHVA